MIDFLEDDILANGIEQHYYRTPLLADRPTVLLLHGVTDNGMCWIRVADALSDQFNVIMLDARGHGLSEAPESGYSQLDRAADVSAAIDVLGLHKPVLYGHSMGADTALVTAAYYPENICAIVLEDPPWRETSDAPSAEVSKKHNEQWLQWISANKLKTYSELVEQARQENPSWPEAELAPWAQSKLQVSLNIASDIFLKPMEWESNVGKTECPVLLITAETARQSIVSPETARKAMSLLKNGRYVHIPGAGHCIHREQFALVMQSVKVFLDEVTS